MLTRGGVEVVFGRGVLVVVPYLVRKLSQPVRLQQQRDEGGGGWR